MSEFKVAEEIKVDDEIIMRRISHEYDQDRFDTIVASHDHLLPWMPWAHFYENTGIEAMTEFCNGQIEAFDKGATLGYDIIYNGKFVGAIDIHNLDGENRHCEIGYWLGKDNTGHGIATRCAAKIAEYAFEALDMHRVVIRAAVGNDASNKVAERLGFPKEATLIEEQRLDGKFYDTNVYAKINPKH